jgi:filamentous hemagglutinin family protein
MFFNTSLQAALAGPEGAEVINGQVSLQQSGNNTVITASDKSIINYSSFDIARPEIVEFIQPSSSASVLNRILSANPTNIDGTLLANGRVFFVNPAGVYIGSGATINVNQLVASALNIANSDFIDGRYNFVGGNGSVTNSGDIVAEKVYLIGKQVANSGSISCPAGYVIMAAGDRVFIGEPGCDVVVEIDPPVASEPVDPVDSTASVLNEGTIDAGGGTIVLAAAGDIYSQAISNVGHLSVSVEAGDAGQIRLTAPGGQVSNAGTIDATSNDGKGGTVEVLGDRVGLVDAAEIDVSGSGGGGKVLVGGDYQGSGDVPTASRTYVSTDSTIKADATDNGDGGRVIVWADEITRFYGDISARGGAEGGDGGFVEVSGQDNLGFYGQVDTQALVGDNGTLLLDPTDLTITDTATGQNLDAGFTGTIEFGAGLNDGTDSVSAGVLEDLAAGTDIILKATNKITIDPLTSSGKGGVGKELTLDQTGDVKFLTGAGGFSMGADNTINVTGAANLTVDAVAATSGGTGDGPVVLGELQTTSGDITVHGTAVTVNGAINSGGNLTVNGSSVNLYADLAAAGSTSGDNTAINVGWLDSTSHGSIQDAIDISKDGASLADNLTITVQPGRYEEDLVIAATKTNLELAGADKSTTTIKGQQMWNNFPEAKPNIEILGDGTKIHDFTIEGPDPLSGWYASGMVIGGVDVEIYNNRFLVPNASNLDDISQGIQTYHATANPAGTDLGGLSIRNNEFSSLGDGTAGYEAIYINRATTDPTPPETVTIADNIFGGALFRGITTERSNVDISGNTLTTTLPAGDTWQGILVRDYAVGEQRDVTIANNIVQGFAQGIRIGKTGQTLTNIDVENNTITANTTGVQIIASASGVKVNRNDISANTSYGMENLDAGTVDATANWWGDTDPSDDVSGNVDYSPWWGGDYVANPDHPWTWWTNDSIQEAIGLVAAYDMINIIADSYAEDVLVNKSVTLSVPSGTATVTSLTSNGGTTTGLTGDFAADATVDPAFLFNGAVTLAGDVTLTSNNDKAITFNSVVDGAYALAVNTGGATTFGGLVGSIGSELTSLTTDTDGHTEIGAGTITLNGSSATFNDPVVLTDNLVINEAGTGNIEFVSTVDSTDGTNYTLTVNSGSGATIFGDHVGSGAGGTESTGLGSLTTNATGTTQINTGTVTTTGAQTYNDDVTLGDNTILTAGSAEFGKTVEATTDGGQSLAVNTSSSGSGLTKFVSTVGGNSKALSSLVTNADGTTSLGGNVTTTGSQTYGDDVILAGNVELAGTGVEFGKTVEAATDGGQSLAVNTSSSGLTKFVSTVGGNSKALSSLVTNADGTTSLGGNVTTTGSQTYSDDVILAGNVILTGGSVEFGKTVEATTDGGQSLAVNTSSSGLTNFVSTVGGNSKALSSLVTNADGTTSLGGNVTTTGDQTYNDNVTVADGKTLTAGNNLVVGASLTGGGTLELIATAGSISGSGTIQANDGVGTPGDLTLRQGQNLDFADFTFALQDTTDLAVDTGGWFKAADSANGGKDENAADQWKSITATAESDILLQGSGNITTKALTSTSGNIEVLSTGGDLIVKEAVNADENPLDSTGGGVSLIAYTGKIYTTETEIEPGVFVYTLDVPVTGYSDAGADIGVDTPGYLAPPEKAAIVVWSLSQELNLGPDAILTANGAYDPLTFDDRLSVGFQLDGDPIDIAIYLSSFPWPGDDIEMGSGSVSIDNTGGIGTLVIDAYDTVTFTSAFENSLTVNRPDNVKRLEVVSRVSEDLQMAQGSDKPGGAIPENFRLPHADDPSRIANGFFDGTYVLRGRQFLSLIARVLGLSNPVPLVPPKPLEPEEGGEVEEMDEEELMRWLAEEGIGVQPYVAGAYLPSLNTDLHLYKAAERLRNYAAILQDVSGGQIAALRMVVAEAPLTEEQMAVIAQRFSEHTADGTRYALAGQWMNALTDYVLTLSTDVGWEADRSVEFVMDKYGSRLAEGSDINTPLFVQMHLERLFGG